MLDPMDVIGPLGDRLLNLAKRLQAQTPLGEPIDTDSVAYKELYAALQESQAELKKAQDKLDAEVAAELAELKGDLTAQQAEQDKDIEALRTAAAIPPAAEAPDGSIAFAFETEHTPAAPVLQEVIERLQRRPLSPAPSAPAATEPGSIWGNMPTEPMPPPPPKPAPTAPPAPTPVPDADPGSLWSQWVVSSPPPAPPKGKDRREDDDWESASQVG